MPKVYNKRRPHEIPEDAVYVGRPSRWGNPYKTSKTKTREQAIREFQTYAELKDFYEEHWLAPLRGKDLVCWCSPLPCHADILIRMANEDIETKRARHAEIVSQKMNDIQRRNENKFRTPIYGRNFQGTTTCVGALYPEGNVQVYWTWKWFDFQRYANDKIQGGSRYCGFQFQNIGHLIGMWDTREIMTGLPYDFSYLITTHFAAFYKKHMTTFVLSQKQREALGISEEEYIRANKTVWGENWQDSGWN